MPLGAARAVMTTSLAAAPAGFPQVLSRTTYASGVINVASFPVTMPPTVNAGDLLVMMFSVKPAAGTTVATPAGWTLEVDAVSGGSVDDQPVFTKVAAGSEGGGTVSVTVNEGARDSACAHTFRIGSWGGTLASVEGTPTNNVNGTSYDPPNHSASWGSKKNLWLIGAMYWDDGETGVTFPAGYTNNGLVTNAAGGATNQDCSVASSWRELEAASENPGAMTLLTSETGACFTLVVEPV